ncbi:UDP binding domain-containing protein [Streptomyces sp. NPDC048751]|uniref:UDP binding domain-containing protein n=1 Tax=Streptomyces sp. NPDC048751 TaxID=3365591 RepID=UPI00371B97AF
MPRALVAGDWHLASVTVAGLLELGYTVHSHVSDGEVFRRLADGSLTANEPGVTPVLGKALADGALLPVLEEESLPAVARECDLSLVSFDTRTLADGTVVDTRPALAAGTLLRVTDGTGPVVMLSQVPAGTSDSVLHTAGLSPASAALVHMPENLRLGRALEDFLTPHRLVVGCNAPALPDPVEELLVRVEARHVVRLSLLEAELVKHGTNAYLAACITLANDIGTVAAHLGADPVRVMNGVRADARIADGAPLRPGEAYAGATLQRDVRALWEAGAPVGRDGLFKAISHANAVHALEPLAVLDRCLDGLADRHVCLLGLTYKPGTSTLRDSPAARFARELTAMGCKVTAFDPVAEPALLEGIVRYDALEDAVHAADCVVLTVEHDEFTTAHGFPLGDTRPRRRLLVRTSARERDSGVPTPAGWDSVDLWQR